METSPSESLPIRSSEDIVLVRTAVRKAALQIKLGLVDQTKLVTAASEIARNALTYGLGGNVCIEEVSSHPADRVRTGIRLTFEDKGPGIPDIARCLTDGYSTGAGMGLGLGGARRLVDEFAIASNVGEGTTVTLTKWSR